MRSTRRCSRNGCGHAAVATLTYIYSDQLAVVGPLAAHAEPHTYDLCQVHAANLTAPRGWQVVRPEAEPDPDDRAGAGRQTAAPPPADDLLALLEAVWEHPQPPGPRPDPRPHPRPHPRPRRPRPHR